MDAERGKRRAARRIEAFGAAYVILSWAGVVFADLDPHEVDALVSLAWAVAGAVVTLSVGLRGLDATAAQIIPAWKGKE